MMGGKRTEHLDAPCSDGGRAAAQRVAPCPGLAGVSG